MGSGEAPLSRLRFFRTTFDGFDLRIVDSPKSGLVGGNLDLRPTSARTSVVEHDLPAFYCRHVRDLDVRDLSVAWDRDVPDYHTEAVRVEAFEDVTLDGLEARQAGPTGVAVALRDGETITVRDCRASPGTETFLALDETRDERLLADNDFADADRAVRADETTFVETGNLLPR